MIWQHTNKTNDVARSLADRHYSRQTQGSRIFTPPGRTFVLRTRGAYWVTSWPYGEYVLHRWPDLWVCSAFRREEPCAAIASDLVKQAVAATRWYHQSGGNISWSDPEPHLHCPESGVDALMVTFVDPAKVRQRRAGFGKCFLKAGFVPDGTTEGGLLAFVLPVGAAPAAQAPIPMSILDEMSTAQLRRVARNALNT